MGCANSLLLHVLHRNGLLANSRILVCDPAPKTTNDRTFCFWLSPEELKENGLESLVEYSWDQVICNDQAPQQLRNKRYYYLSAAALYAHAKAILAQYEFTWEHRTADGDLSELATHVFDSRPPEWSVQHPSDTFLSQSFYGWVVRTEKPLFDPRSFTMMDFSIAQNEHTQFMYVLPFDTHHALLEPTRFGKEPITKDEAFGFVQAYLAPFATTFEISAQEQGIIAMCSSAPIGSESTSHVHRMGAAAGLLKPSTGYSFVRNLHDANAIAQSLQNKDNVVARRQTKKRFAYYDRLLLQILARKPERGKEIFENLFARNKAESVLNFLDETSAPAQEARLMLTLPLLLFLGAAFRDLLLHAKTGLRKVSPALLCGVFASGLQMFGLLDWCWPFLIAGLLFVGLPHGALDHLHQYPGKKIFQLLPYFMLYIALGLGVLCIWLLAPSLALVLFLSYSAWHFGQADLEIWRLKQTTLRPFFWGAYCLLFLLATHHLELSTLLQQMGIELHFNWSALLISTLITPLFWITFGLLPILLFRSWRIIEAIVLLTILSALPLIEAFGIYFIFQHSLNGWRYLTQITHMHPKQLWRQSLPFTLASIGLFAAFYYWSAAHNWGLLFIFLSALSFPHVFFMNRAYDGKKHIS